MSDIAEFVHHTFGTIRGSRGFEDDRPVVIASDVCALLEHSNTRMALTRVDPLSVTQIYAQNARGQMRKTWAVDESGFYELVLGSQKSEAREFKRWVTREVLPQIRQDGLYVRQGMPEALRVRADEKFSYVKLKDFVVHASDYDPSSEASRKAFAKMQNRMYGKIVGLDAQGIKAAREVNTQMLSKTRKDGAPYAADLKVAKNYLQTEELADLNNAALAVVGILGLKMRPFGGVYSMQELHDTLAKVLDSF